MQTSYTFWKEHFDITEYQFQSKLNQWQKYPEITKKTEDLPICQINALKSAFIAFAVGFKHTLKSLFTSEFFSNLLILVISGFTTIILGIILTICLFNPENNRRNSIKISNDHPKTKENVQSGTINTIFEPWMSNQPEKIEKENLKRGFTASFVG